MQISKKATVDIGEHKHDSFLAHSTYSLSQSIFFLSDEKQFAH